MPVTYITDAGQEVALIPAPFVDISKDYIKTGDGNIIGTTFSIRLQGTLLPNRGSPSSNGDFYGLNTSETTPYDGEPGQSSKFMSENVESALGGYTDLVQQSLMTKTQAIRKLFSIEGRKLSIISWGKNTDGNSLNWGIYFYPRINGISIDTNEYRQTLSYSVNLECDEIFNQGGNISSNYVPMGEEDFNSIETVLGINFPDGTNAFSTDFSSSDTQDGSNGVKLYVSDVSENWNVSDTGEYPNWGRTYDVEDGDEHPDFSVTHTISATGKRAFWRYGLIRESWENGKLWVNERVGYDPTLTDPDDFTTPQELLHGVYVNNEYDIGGILSRHTSQDTNVDFSHYRVHNYTRAIDVDKYSGRYNLTENYILSTAQQRSLENVDVNHQFDPVSGKNQVTISVSIQGRELRGSLTGKATASQMDVIASTKYESALVAFAKYKSNSYMKTLAEAYLDKSFNSSHVQESTSHNERMGNINRSMTFNDRSQNVPGSYTESISVSTTAKVAQAATLPVPGRATGPIIQDLGTKSIGSKTINVRVQMSGNFTGGVRTKPNVETWMIAYAPTSQDGMQVCSWITTDQVGWEPWGGSYTRTRTYQFI